MDRFWRGSRADLKPSYNVNSLIDSESLLVEAEDGLQIICDVDKTYIETKFESAVGMIKIAFEDADAKITVQGAPLALFTARWGAYYNGPGDALGPRPLHFLSASPPQLRRVIRDKLAKDGLDWTSDTFKNQSYNIKMGRLKLLKQHVAYKSATILNIVAKASPSAQFILIGDNAELDAFIYVGVKMLLSGELSPGAYRDYLALGKVDEEILSTLDPLIHKDFSQAKIKGILIRNAPGFTLSMAPPLTDLVLPFHSYFEVLLHFLAWNLMPATVLPELTRRLHNDYGLSREELLACLCQIQTHFEVLGRDTLEFKNIEQRLRQGPPLGPLPDRSQFRPGHYRDRVNIDEKSILVTAKNWLKSIEERE
ncbi:MAG: DUF2183 domain-containing protein [Proteobacteria bacterium]|nr:DUF2183 domain-containing protein [Pseudomonadota bacterium]